MGGSLKMLVFTFSFCLLMAAQPVNANKFDNEGNFCRIYIKTHELMVSSYQPETSGGEIFCSNLPAFSKSVIVFDLVNEQLRSTPLSIKIIELIDDQPAANSSQGNAVATSPLTLHHSGSVELVFTPEEGKKYTSLITIEENGKSESVSFPITVKKPEFTIAPSTLTATALSLMTLGVIFIFVRPLILKVLEKKDISSA